MILSKISFIDSNNILNYDKILTMKHKLTILSKTTKAIVIPNTILKELNNPDEFDMQIVDGEVRLKPILKEQLKKDSKILFDTSLDLYKVDK